MLYSSNWIQSNDQGVFPVVARQKERAAGFRTTIHALLRIPYVVGADWFQYYDEPTHGRFDGENFNFGLVDIQNRPYQALTAAASGLDLLALKSRLAHEESGKVGKWENESREHKLRRNASHGVPPAPRNPLGQFKPTLALKHWDREGGFVKPVSEFPLADLYVCWDKKAFYLGLYTQDVTEDTLYRNKTVPETDRAEWIVAVGESSRPIRARIGAGREPIVNEPSARIVTLSGLNLDVRNIAALELPAKLLGRDRLKAGDAIELDCTLLTHGRAYRCDWRGRFTLRE